MRYPALLLSLLLPLAAPGAALAYCAARTCDPDRARCELDPDTGCSISGTELVRPNGCVHFAVQGGKADSLGLTEEQLEQAIAEAFDAWRSVDCGDGRPAIEVRSLGVVDAEEPFACFEAPELNVDTWLLSTELAGEDAITPNSGATAGVTRPSFFADDGEVFDSDVLLNQLWFLVQRQEDVAPLLRVVAMHEAGHALGLAHSRDEDALMYRDYRVTEGRELTPDDVAGICALFPPERELACSSKDAEPAAFEDAACEAAAMAPPPVSTGDSGCSVRAARGAARAPFEAALGALALIVLARRRRSRALCVALAAWLAACAQPAREDVSQGATAQHAPTTAGDPELIERVKGVASACELDATTAALSCQGAADEELASDFLKGKRPRVAALATMASLLQSDDAKLRAVTAQLLSYGFSVKLGDGLSSGAVERATAEALLGALRALPLQQARKITPVTVHAAMLSGLQAELLDAVQARHDPELERMAYRRLMVHGRLAALPAVRVAAAGQDTQLAAAAIEALRGMADWTADEQAVLCPFALSLLDHAEAPRAARASQALGQCSGEHIDALIAAGRALHEGGRLGNVQLVAFMEVCKRPADVASRRCENTLAFLESVAADAKLASTVRIAALSAIGHQIMDDGDPSSVPLNQPARMPALLKKHARDPDPELAKYSGRMLEHLMLLRAAKREKPVRRARSSPRADG